MSLLLVLLSATLPLIDSACVNLSNTTKKDTYLQNNLIGVFKKPSLFDCAVLCQAHFECSSFGFEPRKRLCHLHNVEGANAGDDMVSVNLWIHGDLPDLPKDLWGPCADHHCPLGQKCTTNRVTKKAVCVKGDIALSKPTCPEGITQECLDAICKVTSGCGPPNFYDISGAYFTECGEPGNMVDCIRTKTCSEDCVKTYMSKYARSCTGGKTPTCEDYTRIHFGGPNGCNDKATTAIWNQVEEQLEASPCT